MLNPSQLQVLSTTASSALSDLISLGRFSVPVGLVALTMGITVDCLASLPSPHMTLQHVMETIIATYS